VVFQGRWIVFKLQSIDPYYGEDYYSVALTAKGQLLVFAYGEKVRGESNVGGTLLR
jgi:hypothetical protein